MEHVGQPRVQAQDLREKGLTYRQIAEQLGITIGATSAHLHEARRRIGITREQVLEENRRRRKDGGE